MTVDTESCEEIDVTVTWGSVKVEILSVVTVVVLKLNWTLVVVEKKDCVRV